MKTLSLVLTAMLAAQTGCAGVLMTTPGGYEFGKVTTAGGQYVTEERVVSTEPYVPTPEKPVPEDGATRTVTDRWSCATAGTTGANFATMFVESIRMGLSVVSGRVAGDSSAKLKDNPNPNSCLERGPVAAPNVAEEPEQ